MNTKWLLLPLALLVGCGQPQGEDESDGEQDGEVGTAVSALCSTSTANYSAPLVYNPQSFGGYVSSTSPNASYGNAGCSDRYVLEATSMSHLPGYHLQVEAGWADFTLTQTQCPWTEVSQLVFGYQNGAWQQIGGDVVFTGRWDSESNSCTLYQKFEINVPGLTKLRLAAKASYLDGSGEHPAKVFTEIADTAYVLN